MIGESLEKALETWLQDEADGRVPDHLDAVLAVTLATRQRHGQLRSGDWFSWLGRTRFLAIAAALLLGVAAMTALGIGRQRQHTAPMPVPAADSGVMLVSIDHDLYALDASGSNQRGVVIGPKFEFGAVFSPDGSRFAFLELNDNYSANVIVANADGSERTVVSESRTVGPTGSAWSPDGRRLAILDTEAAEAVMLSATLSIVEVNHPEATHIVALPTDGDLYYGHRAFGLQMAWAGTGDGEIILTGGRHAHEARQGFFAIRPDGSGFREFGQPTSYEYVGLSPDGRWLTYFTYVRDAAQKVVGAQTHIVDVATGEDRVFPSGHGTSDQELLFSPDGTTAAMVACLSGFDGCDLVIVSLDGSAAPRVIGPADGPTPKERRFVYSPDGRLIVASTHSSAQNSSTTILIDVETGEQTVLGDGRMSIEAWQPLPRP